MAKGAFPRRDLLENGGETRSRLCSSSRSWWHTARTPLALGGDIPGGSGEPRADPRRVGAPCPGRAVPCSLPTCSCEPWRCLGAAYGRVKPHFWGPRRTDSVQHSRKAKIPPGKHHYPEAKDGGIPLKPAGSGSAVQAPHCGSASLATPEPGVTQGPCSGARRQGFNR